MAGVSEQLIRKWVADGRIKAERPGQRALEVDKESLIEHLRQPIKGRGKDKAPRARKNRAGCQ